MSENPSELDLIILEIGLLRQSMRKTVWEGRPGQKISPALIRYATTLAKLGEVEARLLKLQGPVEPSRAELYLADLWKVIVKVIPELATRENQEKIMEAINEPKTT